MYNLLNKLFARFGFQLVFKEGPHIEKRCFLDDIKSPEFVNKYPEFLDRYFSAKKNKSLYIGDINYFEDKTGKTYFRKVVGTEHKYFDYDGDTYTPEQLQEKLNNE